MRRIVLPALAVLAALWGGCAEQESRPADLPELRKYLLAKAEEKFEHSFRISLKNSNLPFNQARQQLIYVYVQQGRLDDALGTADEYVKQNRDYAAERKNALAANEAAWEKKAAGDPKIKESKLGAEYEEGRKEIISQIERAEKAVVDMLILQGDIHLLRGKKPESIARYKDVLETRPNHFVALARLGQAHVSLENWTLAAGYLEKGASRIEDVLASAESRAAALDPEDPKDRDKLAEIRRYSEGLSGVREALIASAALCHFLGREFDAFSESFGRILEVNPDSAYLELKIGLSLLRDGHEAQGRGEIEKFLLKRAAAESGIKELALKAAAMFPVRDGSRG